MVLIKKKKKIPPFTALVQFLIVSLVLYHSSLPTLSPLPSPQFTLQPEWSFLKVYLGASLVAQWLRICLPTQGTRVRALVWEDPTCRRATRPVRHNY